MMWTRVFRPAQIHPAYHSNPTRLGLPCLRHDLAHQAPFQASRQAYAPAATANKAAVTAQARPESGR